MAMFHICLMLTEPCSQAKKPAKVYQRLEQSNGALYIIKPNQAC